MKLSTVFSFFIVISFGIIIYAGIDYSTGITGTTQKNGDGCVCHSLNPDSVVWVRIEGPDTLLQGQIAQYVIKLSGGPAVAGGFNIAAFSGFLDPADATVQKIGDELTQTSAAAFVDSIVTWTFYYTSQMMNYTDTLYSVANSVNGDGIPNSADRWNFGVKFPVVVLDVIPVELTSFLAEQTNTGIMLKWITASELNNSGFEIERASSRQVRTLPSQEEWEKIGYVEGNGTTTEISYYSFEDNSLSAGNYQYRLKQIDFDGSITYSNVIEASYFNVPVSFVLEQNYPNPFNPVTSIRFNILEESIINLQVINGLGEVITSLADDVRQAGIYTETWNPDHVASGVYYIRMIAESIVTGKSNSQTIKAVYMK